MAGINLGKAEFKTPKVNVKTDSKKARSEAVGKLISAVQSGAVQVETELSRLLDAAMDSSVWEWRRGGARNIIDTGALKASKKVTVKYLKTKTTFNVTYGAPYAIFVHEGGYIFPYGNKSAKMVFLPPRPWVRAVLEGGGPVESIGIENIMGNTIAAAFG